MGQALKWWLGQSISGGPRSIKGRYIMKEKDIVAIWNQICNQTCEKYIRTNLLGLCQGRIFLV